MGGRACVLQWDCSLIKFVRVAADSQSGMALVGTGVVCVVR